MSHQSGYHVGSAQNLTIKVVPRRRTLEPGQDSKKPVEMRARDILALAHLPQREAADSLGVSLSTLKLACKKLNLPRWPSSRQRQGQEVSEQNANEEITWMSSSFSLDGLLQEAFAHCMS
eukprot:766060-Hanusia_phi.AAC.3